jgi:hypothetical protein
VTAAEAYDLTTKGGATDFGRVISVCESYGPYCLIGGLAVNCYVEPVYTLDAEIAVAGSNLDSVSAHLGEAGSRTEMHPHSLNASTPGSDLRIQLTTDQRYRAFLDRAVQFLVLGVPAKVACLEDLPQGMLWAYEDPQRIMSRRKKDELDLIRLAERYPTLIGGYPAELRELLEKR